MNHCCKKSTLSQLSHEVETDSDSPCARRLKKVQMRFRSEEEIRHYFKTKIEEDKLTFEPAYANTQAPCAAVALRLSLSADDAEKENTTKKTRKASTFSCACWPTRVSREM